MQQKLHRPGGTGINSNEEHKMSAYLVDKDLIARIVRAASHWTPFIDGPAAEVIASDLWHENNRSVSYRYREPLETLEPIPATFIQSIPIPAAEKVVSDVRCLVYQSCEHPEWNTSTACKFLENLRTLAEHHASQETIQTAQAHHRAAQDHEAAGRLWLQAHQPHDATHVIVAELLEDRSDSQSDYYGHTIARTVPLAFSKHGRDLFSEMRKAALRLPETQHLGPGRDIWTVRLLADPADEYHRHYTGRLTVDGIDHWSTRAEAQAQLDAALARDHARRTAQPFVSFCPEIPHGAELGCESIEHREKYSMGAGYYLGHGAHSGWRIRKRPITGSLDTIARAIGANDHTLA